MSTALSTDEMHAHTWIGMTSFAWDDGTYGSEMRLSAPLAQLVALAFVDVVEGPYADDDGKQAMMVKLTDKGRAWLDQK